ncbi:MAG: hypothetical protein ACTSQI_13275 [Candidatus Helarchaeota archaeon]
MKEVKIFVLHPDLFKILDEPVTVMVDDEADVVQAIAAADKVFLEKSEGDFPLENLFSLLQLVWDVNEWNFFVDVGIDARAPDKSWLPLRDDPELVLPAGADIRLNPDAGC